MMVFAEEDKTDLETSSIVAVSCGFSSSLIIQIIVSMPRRSHEKHEIGNANKSRIMAQLCKICRPFKATATQFSLKQFA